MNFGIWGEENVIFGKCFMKRIFFKGVTTNLVINIGGHHKTLSTAIKE